MVYFTTLLHISRTSEGDMDKELLYRTIVEFSSDLIFWVSPDRTLLHYISPTCDQLTGYGADEFYADPDLLNRIIHPDFQHRWEERMRNACSLVRSEPLELAIRSRDGITRWVSNLSRPVYSPQGDYLGIRGNFSDIADRKKTEELLHRQNEYLTALHETTLGMVSRLEINSLLATIIARAAKLMNTEHGYIYLLNSDETGMDIRVQLGAFDTFEHHPLRRGEGMAGHVWQSGVPLHVDDYSTWPGRIPDPTRDILKAMVGIPLTSNGKVVGVIGLAYLDAGSHFDDEKVQQLSRFAELASLALDNACLYQAVQKELDERIKAEERLRKLSHAVEQSPVSIVITDTAGNIEYANPHFSRLTGYRLEELLGKNPRVLKSGFTTQAQYKELWETILAGCEWRGELHNRKKNGDYYWEQALISPIRDQNGTITHFIAIKEDITDRKKLENQLRHSQKMEAVGQLAGGIAHDFNNILTAIIGYATIMQMKMPSDNPFRNAVNQILTTAERGASLTQGLLAFSRKQVSNPVRIDLNEVIRRVEKLLLRLISEDIHLVIPLSQEELPVMADSMEVEQVIMNLATNARDAMPSGGTITITADVALLDSNFVGAHGFGEEGRYAKLSVCDTGCGMSDDIIKRIFEPFFTTKETGKGTGLGLSIAYGIVKKYNGFIICTSAPGTGSDFSVYLPLCKDIEDRALMSDQQVEADYHGGCEVILLAEDDEPTRSLSCELLQEFGYTVIEASDGTQAKEMFLQHRDNIQLVILDAVMPGMKGIEVYREITAVKPEVKVLFCSGYASDILEKPGDALPQLHFIAKPFTPKELLLKIREVLEHAA